MAEMFDASSFKFDDEDEQTFDASSFKFDDEDEQMFDASSFRFDDEDAVEPAPQKRGVAMSPEEMNVPAAAIETKEDAKAKGGMSANEVAASSYEQATGADAPENAILAHIANMGNNLGGRLNANLQMQAAQQLAEGNSRSDDETRGLFSKMMYGATKYLGASLFVDDALDEWDETEGKSYATPEERTAARNEFANELARQFIAERTATKQNASTELENRERGFVANVFGKGPEQIGNMLPYMLGPVGIALHFAEEAGAAGTGYANDEYGFAKDGSLGVVAEGDSAGRAALKGVASSAIETATELIGGKLASAVLKRGGKILVGQFPVITRSAGKIAQTKVGQTVAKLGGKMKDAFKLVSKKMHWDGLPEETIEELESDVLNSLLGTGARDSEYVNAETGERLGAGGRFVEGLTSFFKPENFIELQEAMLLTMGAGGFMAHMSQRGAQKQVDSFLKSKGIMDAEEIKNADLRTKAAAMDAYTKGLSEEQVREKLDTASGVIDGWNKWLDKKLTKIAGEESDTEKVVTLKNFLTEMDSYNSLVERAGEVDAIANERGETTRRFTVQTDENGAPKFNRTIVISPATGESVTRDEMHDLDAGVTVIDTAGAYEVKSDVTGETFKTQSFNRAVNAADAMAVLNQQRIVERETKAQVLGGILNSEQYAGRKFEVVETAQQARDAFGGDIEDDSPGFTTADGTTVLILDNLDDPKTAIATLDKGTPEDRGAFADGVNFETETDVDENGEPVETKIARDKVHGVSIADNGDGTFTVWDQRRNYAEAPSLEDAVTIANGAKPKVKMSKKKEDEPNETGNGADEAQAKPEQGAVQQPPEGEAGEAETPVAPRAEAADAGVASVDNLHPLLRGAAVSLAENGSNPDDPGHRLKTASKAEILSAQKEIVDALNNPDPQAYEAFLDNMNRHACRLISMQQFKTEWKRLHPEVGLENTPHALAMSRKALEVEIKNAEEEISNHPNSKHFTEKLQKAKKELADFDTAHPEVAKESSATPSQPAENAPTAAPKPTEASTPAKPAESVEAASRASDEGVQFVRPGSKQQTEVFDTFTEGRRFVESASGRLVEQRMIDPKSVLNGNDKNSDWVRANLLENKTWDEVVNMPSTQKYIQMYKDGTLPPPANVIVMDNGKLRSLNRRRIVAAIEAGVDNIPANVETGERILQETLEKLQQDASTASVPMSAFKKPSSETPAAAPTKDERKAAKRKAKREASRAATLERAKAVEPPSWLGKNAGPAETRIANIADYLGDRAHNRASLHRAIRLVRDYAEKHGPLALSKEDKGAIADALADAEKRLEKMKQEDQRAFAERNAELPKRLLDKYLEDHPDPVLERLAENGAILGRPRSAAAAKKAAGGEGALRDERFDGKLFDPSAEGADELNLFFDGMKGAERGRWLRIIFGKDTKEVTVPVVTGNDAVSESLGLSVGEILSRLREAVGDFQAWRDAGAENEEERHYRELYEEEEAALDETFGPIDQYRIDELEARSQADRALAAAKAFVENRATAKDIAVYSPSALSAAEEGDAIRIDHQKKTYEFDGYDAKNGILYVNDFAEVEVDDAVGVVREPRRFRVTEDGFTVITEENDNGNRRTDETRPADNGASDEEGADAGRGGEEGEGGRQRVVSVAGGAVSEDRKSAATARAREAYGRVANALDPKWAAEHPDEVAKLLTEGVDISAVASNPAIRGTDKISWPITATRIGSREDAANVFRVISDPGLESTKVLYLDEDGNILDQRVVAVGVVGATSANVGVALANVPERTYGVVFSHNHPAEQGDSVKPTPEDVEITRKLKAAIEEQGLRLLDHIVTDHNAYASLGAGDALLASDGAAEFWDKAQSLSEFFGESVAKPADTMNLVPYGERIDMTKNALGKLDTLAALVSKAHDKSSWVVGIDGDGRVPFVASLAKGGDIAAFLAAHPGAQRYAVLNGENAVDTPAFVRAIEDGWNGNIRTRPLVVAVGENGRLADFAEKGLNDKILNAAKPAAPAPAPRLANAPKLNDKASKAIDDILGEMGGILGTNGEQLYAPVEPLSLSDEEEDKFFSAVRRMARTLKENGYDTFEDMIRVVASRRPDLYGRAKDLFRRAWNFYDTESDGITIARGREIFGKIDNELNRETTNDSARNEQDRVGSGAAEQDRSLGDASVSGGTRVGDDGSQTVLVGGRSGFLSDNGDGRGRAAGNDEGDSAESGAGGRAGVGGDAGGERAGVEPGAGSDGETQRNTEGVVHELTEVTPGFAAYEPPADLPVKAPKSQSLIVESSALASVVPPKIETKPAIPDSIPENGILQAHQYQAVCQAVNAHNKLLPDGRRMGYFCGDGTGVGKTRVIAGVMLDAVNRKLGNGKALIISKNNDLFNSALDDFEPFGIADRLFQLDEKGRKRLVGGAGIAFTTYPSLAKDYGGTEESGNIRSRGKGECRYAQLIKWLGKDFDGVIAFDEAHSAAKGEEVVSGNKQASWTQSVLDLQNALPNARILYLTATAAYDAKDLRFLQRMGLWGKGAGFKNQREFATAINDGGLSMMELLTQSMKARGQYCSRSISFKGVTCRREIAALTNEQKETYSQYADVIRRIHDAAMALAPLTNDKPLQIAKQYFGRALDLFNSLMTAMKIQKAIEIGRQAIGDGKSPVFQLISTNDAAKKAKNEGKKSKRNKSRDINLFSSPEEVAEANAPEEEVGVKDRILAYLNGNSFPVKVNTGTKDADGDIVRGEEVPEAVALRNEMAALVNALPDVGNPIDELVKAFKDVGVSRISSGSNKSAEAEAFNSGKNLALVFSGAGGTGASYHADRRFKNQRQRVQIPIEFGWEPDKFIQALGRSHRNNQVVAPEFVLLTTDIAGEMRFMSTIANRVASMGAIVGGDRNSSGQVVSANDSMDNTYGHAAIRETMRKLSYGQIPLNLDGVGPYDLMFLDPRPEKLNKLDSTKFLGRIQMLPVDAQNTIYSDISAGATRAIEEAKADGTYDDGIRKIEAKRVIVKGREALSEGANPVDLLTVGEWRNSPRINHEQLEARPPEGRKVEYVRNKKSGRLYGVFPSGDKLMRLAPDGSYVAILPLDSGNYEKVATESARAEWDAEYAKLPAEVERVNHYAVGDLIPTWDKIGVEGRPYVYRAQPQGADPFIGLHITDVQLPVTLYGFGKKDEARKFFKENAYRLAREGIKLNLGAATIGGEQPYIKRARIGTRYFLVAFRVPEGSRMESDFANNGWQDTWAKDESNAFDHGGRVYFRDFEEDTEAAFNALVDKHGVVIYRGNRVGFETRDGLSVAPEEPTTRNADMRRNTRRETLPQAGGRTNAGSLGARLEMPQMRMRVQNGELIVTNTDIRRKNDLKLAFGGEWANRARDGKRYVKSDLRWNKTPNGGWWSIPLNKVPANILAEIEDDGVLYASVAPITSVEDLRAEGGVERLSQNPDELKATLVYNLLRAEIAPLFDSNNKVLSEKELLRRAIGDGDTLYSGVNPLVSDESDDRKMLDSVIDNGDMTALSELYNRYMGPNAEKGGLRGLVIRAMQRKGMGALAKRESEVDKVIGLVWAGRRGDGSLEYQHDGVVTDLLSGNTSFYKKVSSLKQVFHTKIDWVLSDMAKHWERLPEMLTLDAPSRTRESESELDQQVADDPGAAEELLTFDASNEYIEDADDTDEDVAARKLGDTEAATGRRRLSRAERKRIEAMDMLEETMYFLPEELQDVINAVLTEERKRGWIEPERSSEKRIAKASLENAQKASGLSPRVFGYRYRTAKELLNEIWHNIKNDKNDENIAIKASEVAGAQETDDELNEDVLDNLDVSPDARRVLQLLLDGEAVQDIADAFKLPPALIRAWKARAQNEYDLKFPADPNENPLGLDLGEPAKREKKPRGPRAPRMSAATWTPDLFAVANATINDEQNFKIEEGIAAGATNIEIAREVGVAPEIVELARIRQRNTERGPVVAPGKDASKTVRNVQTRNVWNEQLGHFELRRVTAYMDGSEYIGEIVLENPQQDTLFAPMEPLEQGTLGVRGADADEIFGFTNAADNEWRSERGFPELRKGARVPLETVLRNGAAMANNVDEMRRMVERLEKAPYAINETDQTALGVFMAKMKSRYNDLARLKAEQYANGNEAMAIQTDMEMDELFTWIDRAQRVNRKAGETWGRTGRARQLAIDKAGNLADYMISCAERKGSPLTKSEMAEAEKIYKTFEAVLAKYDNLTMDDVVAQLDALSKIRLARQQDDVKERKGRYSPENVERDYAEALAQIRYHGEHRSGGTLHGLPGGQKWIRAIEVFHLMNGEGLTDGKPDGAKMAQLVLDDILAQGVDATLWDVRQMESRMGNLIKPSQDEISKSLRDLHAQMLVEQQIEHILSTGTLPPKTGIDRDEDSAAVRTLRRLRDRVIREKGISRKTHEEQLKSALDAYKRRLQNQIEDNERALSDIEAGLPYEPQERTKLQLDEEAQALKERNKFLKERIAELTRDPAKEHDKRVERAMATLARRIAVRKEQLLAAQQQGASFDFDAQKPQKIDDPRIAPLRAELDALNKDFKALKKSLYPDGTDAEIAHKLKLRLEARQRQLDRWNKMAAEYKAADTWAERWAAVAPEAKRPPLESEATLKAAKERDAARRKVLEYREQLKNEQDRSYLVKAWARFIGSTSVLARAMLDMTVVGIQGGKFLRSHPLKALNIAGKATKAFFTQKSADRLAAEIKSHPYFEDFKKNGGHVYSMDGLEGEVPEDFRAIEQGVQLPSGKVITAESIPGVKRSSRSFAGFLNKAALELYADMVEAAGSEGAGANEAQKKLLAEFVNISLGYGYGKKDAGKRLGIIPAVLDAIAWAPRKAVAELKHATGWSFLRNLDTRKDEISNKEIWNVDKQIGREYLRYTLGSLAFGACLLLLAKLVNGDDDDDRNRWSDMLDPRSSDFGRVRIGNTTYSVFAGNEMVWRLLARLFTQQKKTNGVVKEAGFTDTVMQYLRGKVNPIAGTVWDVAEGKNYVGEKLSEQSTWDIARNYLLPLTANALYDNFAKNPDEPLAAIINAVPTFYGATSATYERDPLERVVAQGDEAKRRIKSAMDDESANRIGARLDERGEVYGAAKNVSRMEKKLKNLEAQAKMFKYTIDRSKDGGSPQLKKNYADILDAIEKMKSSIEAEREEAMSIYRKNRNRGIKWDDMGWTE